MRQKGKPAGVSQCLPLWWHFKSTQNLIPWKWLWAFGESCFEVRVPRKARLRGGRGQAEQPWRRGWGQQLQE